MVNVGDVMSEFDRYIKFTEMLNDAEDELGISSFSGVEKEIIYTIVKAARMERGFPSRIYCKGSISQGNTLSSFASLVDSGYLSKDRDPNDARRNIIAIAK